MRARTVVVAATLLAVSLSRPALAQPERPGRWGAYSADLVDEAGAPLPTFHHRGRTYVLGATGQRYLLRVHNATGRRAEVVASVDGRDVIDGRPASWQKRGYVVEPYGTVTIDGFRLSEAAVAAFRFSSVPRSYASRMGDARDVGVVGVAFFAERWRRPSPVAPPFSAPSDDLQRHERRSERAPGDAGEAPAAPSVAQPPERQRDGRGLARPGLGTEFGEEHGSPVRSVSFVRATATPETVLSLRYDDREGLLALGIDIDIDRRVSSADDDARLREAANPFRRNGFAEPPPGWGR